VKLGAKSVNKRLEENKEGKGGLTKGKQVNLHGDKTSPTQSLPEIYRGNLKGILEQKKRGRCGSGVLVKKKGKGGVRCWLRVHEEEDGDCV